MHVDPDVLAGKPASKIRRYLVYSSARAIKAQYDLEQATRARS